MRVVDLIRLGVNQLELAGVDQANREVELLLGYCLAKNRAGLFLASSEEVDEQSEQQFSTLLARRVDHEPSAYILGEQEFWSLPFLVTPAVLIPRPETEFLLETVFAACRKRQGLLAGSILDLCCGSGVIGIILARELERSVTAVDLSAPALQVARQNAERHQVADRLAFVQSDLFCAFGVRPHFSLVVSNPPYVSEQELRNGLQPEVAYFEPHLALDGGAGGLDIIKRIRMDLPQVLRPGGEFFMEIGADQGPAVKQLFSADKTGGQIFDRVEVLSDYTGRDRVLHARRVIS